MSFVSVTKDRKRGGKRWNCSGSCRQACFFSFLFLLLILLMHPVSANTPPRFVLEDGGLSEHGGDIVVRLKEGPTTPPGTKILHLRGSDADGDPMTFGVRGKAAEQLLRVQNHPGGKEASLHLNQVLDAEVAREFQVVLTLTDGHLGAGNFITQSLLLLVEDVNDNPPVFLPFPHSVQVEEHSGPKTIATVEARDRDSGIFGQVSYSLARQEDEDGKSPPLFAVDTTADGKGIVKVVGDLDFETRSVYQLQVLATDGRAGNFGGGQVNTATAAILVRVTDVADQPPEFVSVPSVTRVPEDVATLTEILRVRAVDGDRAIGNSIAYSIVTGPTDIFAINADTGVVYTQVALDRESPRSSNGAFILGIEAREVGGGRGEEPRTRTEVTIIVEDVNDEVPAFRSPIYVAEIAENSQRGGPVTFLAVGSGGDKRVLNEVFDHDRGTNGTFGLFIEGDGGMFEVSPSDVINEASFTIRVRDESLLDYEALRTINFTLVARENSKEVKSPQEGRAKMTVHIRDQNDNSPEFNKDPYEVEIPEDIASGATVAWIRATDRDSGMLGTDGIRYTRLSGPLANYLVLDPQSGIITLSVNSSSPSPFDREVSDLHFLTVEARDELGKGNRNTVELILRLRDVNDNAPAFRQDSYETFLPENSADFPAPFLVRADDRDENGTDNAQVRYRIMDDGGNFTIDSVTGVLRPSGSIDYERMKVDDRGGERAFRLTVRAFDLGMPPLQSDVQVVVFVTDKNDFAPEFERDLYEVALEEDTEGGTEVIKVLAIDRDGTPPNNRLVYRIQSGAKDKFVIDPETGVISVRQGASLDPDLASPRATAYHLEVTAFDGGVGDSQLSGSTSVNVSIVDVNNKDPVFEGGAKVRTVSVTENVGHGFLVTKILAADSDQGSRIVYSLDPAASEAVDELGSQVTVNLSRIFEVDSASGELRVVGDVDREKFETARLGVVAEDVEARKKPQVATAAVLVRVMDENDNGPVFSQKLYRATVPENAPAGTNMLKVLATDLDKNRTVTYSLEGPAKVIDHVKLNSESGEVSAGEKKIDYEAIRWLNFSVRAVDSGFPPRSTLVPVVIAVLDENDNSPVFRDELTKLLVSEAIQKDSVIARLRAEDGDDGEYGKVTYFLDQRSASTGRFKIHPDTGELSVLEVLDREKEGSYNLIVQAYDNYQFGFTTGDARVAFTQVSIQVTDVNDEGPVFVVGQHSSDTCKFVTEFHDLAEPILTVLATDADDPSTDNSRIIFDIIAGNDLKLFRIESAGSASAVIFPDRQLKGLYGNYTLTVKATDGGFPSNSDTAAYGICVQDFNDNAPIFTSPPTNFTVRVLENATVGSEIIKVRAVDSDVGTNGEVRYRIRNHPGGHHLNFRIDPVTGLITLTKELDRERQRFHELRVEAYDLGVPTALQSDLDITVYVRNVNDHQPQFSVDEFVANFTEHKGPGAESFRLPSTVDRDDEDDYDATGGERLPREVCYFIVEGNELGIFELLPQRHELILNRELDREKQAEYFLTVKASEDCFFQASSPSHDDKQAPISFSPTDDSLLHVRVVVGDIDDNPPSFAKAVFTGGISTDIDFGTPFMRVKAEDPDEGENARLQYSLDGEILPSAKSEGLEGIRQPPFLVGADTGEIRLNFDPQKGMKGHFDFEVRAFDQAGHVAKAKVQIYLLREDQRVKFVMRSHPTETRERIDRFQSVMAKVTDAVVNVDAFRVHEVEDGSGVVDKTKTDVLMHFVHRKDHSVMEVADVLKMIDYRTEELDGLFREYDVINTEGADPLLSSSSSQPRRWASAASESATVLWLLLSACVFLVLLLILVVGLCLHQRSKYNRQLRAALASAFGDRAPESVLNKREVVPNTNRHASEGSNPVWMTGPGYANFQASKEDEDEEDEGIQNPHNYHLATEDGMDSLDANVLNDSLERRGEKVDDDEEDAGCAASSHFSTIRVTSTTVQAAPGGGGGTASSTRSTSSSGLGSGGGGLNHDLSRGHSLHGKGVVGGGLFGKNLNISALFPPQMPPVERLAGVYGRTMYDEDDIPRTEL